MIWILIFSIALGGGAVVGRALLGAGASKRIAGISVVGLAVASIALYAQLGTPDSQDSHRQGAGKLTVQGKNDKNGPRNDQDTYIPPFVQQETVSDLEDAVALLEQKLEEGTDGAQRVTGLMLLGQGYMSLADYKAAAVTFAQARTLAPEDVSILAAEVEALIFAANGIVREGAWGLLQELTVRAPDHLMGRFYSAVLLTQKGEGADTQQALDEFLELYKQAAVPKAWRYRAGREAADIILRRSQLLSAFDVEASLAYPDFTSAHRTVTLSQSDAAAVGAMVSGLAERLKTAQADLEGWLRLGRSYAVLGNRELSMAAFKQAIQLAQAQLPETTAEFVIAQQGLAKHYIGHPSDEIAFEHSLDAILAEAPNDAFALYQKAVLAQVVGDGAQLDLYQGRLRRLLAPGLADARYVEEALSQAARGDSLKGGN